MRSGFVYPFDTPAGFSVGQRQIEGFSRDLAHMAYVEPDERGSVIHLNSTWMEMIDRWHEVRGCLYTTIQMIITPPGVVLAIFGICMGFEYLVLKNPNTVSITIFVLQVCFILSIFSYALYASVRPVFKAEFFSYTHFPIRFNRKTRMIHVFRHNGPGGVLSVPWDEAYFHVGHGTYEEELLDLRGHVMNGDNVVDTFAVGNIFDAPEDIKRLWKFIVIYMEQGPQALPEDNSIMTTANRSLRNQFFWGFWYCKNFFHIPLIEWIFIALITGMRWLIMKSCKDPVWPPEIEAESAIAPDDPYVWKEPAMSGQATRDKEAELRANRARAKRLGKKF